MGDRDERGKFLKGHTIQPSDDERPTGLARVDSQPILSAEQVQRALSGYIIGQLGYKKEQLTCLKLLGELHGLWGPGRKPPASGDKPKAEGFRVAEP